MTTIWCRPATQADWPAARAVIEAAFGGVAEADLVEQLALDGDLAAHIVAVAEDDLVGSLALSAMTGMNALALAPLAVAPAWQRRGIGAKLVVQALGHARANGAAAVFVLGDPAYYEPLGFSRAAARPVCSPYAGPHFMAANLAAAGDLAPANVGHARAFKGLG